MTTSETLLHDLAEVQALPHRTVIKDSRHRFFQIRHDEDGTRSFMMFGNDAPYFLDGSKGDLLLAFPVTVLWSGRDVLLTGGYDDPNWIN